MATPKYTPNPILSSLAMGAQATLTAKQRQQEEQALKAKLLATMTAATSTAGMHGTLMGFNVAQQKRFEGIQKLEQEERDINRESMRQKAKKNYQMDLNLTEVLQKYRNQGGLQDEVDIKLLDLAVAQASGDHKLAVHKEIQDQGGAKAQASSVVKGFQEEALASDVKMLQDKISQELMESQEKFEIFDPATGESMKDSKGNTISETYSGWTKHLTQAGMAVDLQQKQAIYKEINSRVEQTEIESDFMRRSIEDRLSILKNNKLLGVENLNKAREELKEITSRVTIREKANSLMMEAYDDSGNLKEGGAEKIRQARVLMMKTEPNKSIQETMEEQYNILLSDESSPDEKEIARKKIDQYQIDTNKNLTDFKARISALEGSPYINPSLTEWLAGLDEDQKIDWLMSGAGSGGWGGTSSSRRNNPQAEYWKLMKLGIGNKVSDNATGQTVFTAGTRIEFNGKAEDAGTRLDTLTNMLDPKDIKALYKGTEGWEKSHKTPINIAGITFGAAEGLIRNMPNEDWATPGLMSELATWSTVGRLGSYDKGIQADIAAVFLKDFISDDSSNGTMQEFYNDISKYAWAKDEKTGEFILGEKDLKTFSRDVLAKKVAWKMINSSAFKNENNPKVGWRRNAVTEKLLSGGLLSLFNSLYIPMEGGSPALSRSKLEDVLSQQDMGLTPEESRKLLSSIGRHWNWHGETNDFMVKFSDYAHLRVHPDIGGDGSKANNYLLRGPRGTRVPDDNWKSGSLIEARRGDVSKGSGADTNLNTPTSQVSPATTNVPNQTPAEVPQEVLNQVADATSTSDSGTQPFFPGFEEKEESGLTPPPGAGRASTDLEDAQGPEVAITVAEAEEIEGLEKTLAQFIIMRDTLLDRYKGDPKAMRGTIKGHMHGIDNKIKDLEDRIEVLKKRPYKKAS